MNPPKIENIPDALKPHRQWVNWRIETRAGKPTKPPFRPDGRRANVTDPATWSDFPTVAAAHSQFNGVGFVLTKEDDFVGVDLDKCLNPETGELADFAQKIVSELPTYCEVSPSGRGLHLFARGKLPPGRRRKGPVEIYESERFLTVTGQRFGAIAEIRDCTAELATIHARLFPPEKKSKEPPAGKASADLGDGELIDKARRARNGEKFSQLWAGDLSGYGGDHSAADLALCGLLAFWTGNDPDRIDRLFRQSALMRPKWDAKHGELTYGEMTLRKALETAGETYKPRAPHPPRQQDKPRPDRQQNEPPLQAGEYRATAEGFFFGHARGGEVFRKRLSNFTAQIVEERIHDDGVESENILMVEGRMNGTRLPTVALSFETFAAMAWPSKHWGSGIVVEPGMGAKDQLRYAIQTLSHADEARAPTRRTVYRHTGWRSINGERVYLHGAGGIGAGGAVPDTEVALEGLSGYALPAPSQDSDERRAAAAASLATLEVAPHAITLALWGAVYLAPLASVLNPDFFIWAEGRSQSKKSTLAALFLSHYGKGFDYNHLPASWHDTPGSLEFKLFALKDSLTVVDDYAPQPTAARQGDLDNAVSALVRSGGNLSGRSRLDPSAMRLRADRPPRGLTIATAEQFPPKESLHARLFGVFLERGQVDIARLNQAQTDAREGLLARALADYLVTLARDWEAVVSRVQRDWQEYRAAGIKHGLYGRLAAQFAFLMVGIDQGLSHARACGVELDERCYAQNQTLLDLARRQTDRIAESTSAERFRSALLDLLASGAGYVQTLAPDDASLAPGHVAPQQGALLGYRRKGQLLLLKNPTLEHVNQTLQRGGHGLTGQPSALWRELRERGWLLPGDRQGNGNHRTERVVKIFGNSTRVLAFDESALENL